MEEAKQAEKERVEAEGKTFVDPLVLIAAWGEA